MVASCRSWREATLSVHWGEASLRTSKSWLICSAEQKCRTNPAVFAKEDVVGAAGRAGVHDFQADSRVAHCLSQSRMRETQNCPCAQQEDLYRQLGELLECHFVERLERIHFPLRDSIGQYDETVFVT